MRLSLSALLAPAALAFALSAPAAVPNRLHASIQEGARTSLSGTIPARARMAQDLGLAAPDHRLTELTLRFSLTAAQQAALDRLVLDQQNPSSPRYHQWLTPEQYASQFGLSPSDLVTVSNWLTSQGFTVTGTARSSTFISFAGTVAQAQAAFGTTIHSLSVDGETHIGNLTEPTLPAGLAAVVTGVTGLNDLKLKSRARVRTVKPAVTPDFTSSVSGNHYIAPGDFYTIYDVNPLIAGGITGAGITIGVMGQTDISLADDAAFRSASGLAANPPTVKLYGTDPGTSAADIDEAMLDVEWAGAVAPGANILYVNSTDVIGGSLTQAVDNNLAPIMSVSYGDCESGWGKTYLNLYNQLFEQANAQGITIVGPAGDSGATDCDSSNSLSASNGLAVDFPASSPYVTGAGGSMFNEGSGTYFSATNNANQGSALSYIPEAVWNETSLGGGLAASGGGASAFFTKPAWQTGTNVPNDFSRDVPDLALNAASSHDGTLYCAQGFCTNGYRNASGNLDVVGGTSVAAPSFAGILALLEQKIGTRIGNANPTLYSLGSSMYYNSVFHDITTGNNNSPCTSGTVNCYSGLSSIGYSAGIAYDLASGWGSIDAFNLVNDWKLVTPTGLGSTVGTAISSTTVTAPTTSVTAGTSISLSALVTSGSTGTTATPTGTVQFEIDNAPTGAPVTLASAGATYTLTTTCLSSGTHTVSASYSGDTIYAGSRGALQITINSGAVCGDFTLTPASTSVTVSAGSSTSSLPFTVTSLGGFTGAVTFSASVNSNSLPNYTSVSFSTNPVSVSATSPGATGLVINAYVNKAISGVVAQSRRIGSHTSLPSSGQSRGTGQSPWVAVSSGASLAALLLFALPRRRRLAALIAVFASLAMIGGAGCSSSSSVQSANSTKTNAATGTYNITVTATYTSSTGATLAHNAAVTLVVQ